MQHLLSDAPAMPGLLWAMRFDETGLGQLVPHGEALPTSGNFGEAFVWLHFNLNDARLADVIGNGRFGPAHLVSSAFGPDPHQRIAVEGGYIGGVVADLVQAFYPEANADAGGRLHFVMGPHFLVSGRRHPVLAPEAAREAVTEGRSMSAPIVLLETLVGHVIASMSATGGRLVDELDVIEDRILERRTRGERRRLGPIRRDAVRLHRQLLGLRAVFHRLEAADEGEDIAPEAIKTAARIAQRLDALDRDMVMIADRSRLMQEEVSAHLAEESNRQIYTLSILTAMFLPPTLVTGLFGMNTKSLPLSDWENGSTVAIAIGVLSAATVFAVIRVLGIKPPRD